MERGCERVWWELLLSELSPKSGIFLVPDTAPWPENQGFRSTTKDSFRKGCKTLEILLKSDCQNFPVREAMVVTLVRQWNSKQRTVNKWSMTSRDVTSPAPSSVLKYTTFSTATAYYHANLPRNGNTLRRAPKYSNHWPRNSTSSSCLRHCSSSGSHPAARFLSFFF